MKIEITPDGTVRLESNGSSPADVAAFTLSLQQELKKQAQAEAEAEAKSQLSQGRPVSLNDKQGETYDYLVANDNPNGIHLSAMATHFGVSKSVISHRLCVLQRDGFVYKVAGGKWRAVTA